MAFTINVNGVRHSLDVDADMPLLWALRDQLNLTGTKYGCGVASCGACTVHINGEAVRSCSVPVESADGAEVTTIEGIGDISPTLVQKAWIAHQVPQCGYCQSGMIMAVSALLRENPNPTDEDIDESITNICRCGTYTRVRAAIHDIARAQREGTDIKEAAL